MGAQYEFLISVGGKSVEDLKKIEDGLKRLGVTAATEMRKVGESANRAESEFGKLQTRIIEVFAVDRIIEFGRQVLDVTAEFEGFDNRIKFASMSMTDAAINMSFLKKEVIDLHQPIRQVYEGFSEMEAGLRGTGIEGQRLRDLFDGLSTAAATLHLPEFQLQRTQYDLKEIGEIGLNGRIIRSLGTALPNIAKIVQDTFGKSMRELEKDGISGTDFLTKLGPALRKNFESGLEAFGGSLQAKLNDTKNKFIEDQVDLGNKLKPVYISIMNGLSGIMDTVKGFIDYLSTHQELVRRIVSAIEALAIAFIAYKAAIISSTVATWLYNAAMEVMTIAENTATYGLIGLTDGLESLGVAFSTVGVGAFAIALGFLVEQFREVNGQIDEAVEKMTHLQELAPKANSVSTAVGDANMMFANRDQMNAYQRGEAFNDVTAKLKSAQDISNQLSGNIKNVTDSLHKQALDIFTKEKKGRGFWELLSPGVTDLEREDSADSKERFNLAALRENLANVNKGIQSLHEQAYWYKAHGMLAPVYPNAPGDPTGRNANHSTRLSGAEGGINQAKVVNLKIDTIQKNYGVKGGDLPGHAEHAVQVILRAVNNLSESQSAQY